MFIISVMIKSEFEWKMVYFFWDDGSFSNCFCNSIIDKESDVIVCLVDDYEWIWDIGIYNFGIIIMRVDGLNDFIIYLKVSDEWRK